MTSTGAPILGLDMSQDMHVHSTFSDGASTIADNVAHAASMGLTRFCSVDHVRADTSWVPDFVSAVRQAASLAPLQVFAGVEAKLLDRSGTLDLPADRDGIDYVFIADHQVPLADGPHHPASVRADLKAGRLQSGTVVASLVEATIGALEAHPGSVIAHLFSILPKLGLSEADVSGELVGRLASAALRTGAILEISERWRCPSLQVALAFHDYGVPIVCSTDSHRTATIGRYDYVTHVHEGLRGRR
ncbi:MAG: PHP domain-containing protein [Acidobacteriota bacterium]|nr:PHP domain-containing protein [Acidobacteriota bacterium]